MTVCGHRAAGPRVGLTLVSTVSLAAVQTHGEVPGSHREEERVLLELSPGKASTLGREIWSGSKAESCVSDSTPEETVPGALSAWKPFPVPAWFHACLLSSSSG